MLIFSFIFVTVFFAAVTYILGRFAGQRWDAPQSQEGIEAIITYGAAAVALLACMGAFSVVLYIPTIALIFAIVLSASQGATVFLILEAIAGLLLLVLSFWVPYVITRNIINRHRIKPEPVAESEPAAPAADPTPSAE